MKQTGSLVFGLIVGAVIAFAVGTYGPVTKGDSKRQETSYERVIRTGTLRCGYEFWEGAFMQDPKTNQLHGPWKDFIEELGRTAKLKIEWSDHVGWGVFPADLKTGKIDAMCAGVWQDAARSKEIALSQPIVYFGMEAFAHQDDHRFDGNISAINNPDVSIVVIEGDATDLVAQQEFPLAKRIALGNATDMDMFLNVGTKKADVTLEIPGLWRQYDKANPGKVRRVDPGHYLKTVGVGIAVANDDWRLQHLMNVAVAELANSGTVDRILKKYEKDYPDMFMKAALTYVP